MLFSYLLFRLRHTTKIEIIQYFLDKPEAALSLHNICDIGHKSYKSKINEYWTPLTALLATRDQFKEAADSFHDFDINFFTFHNNTIDFREMAIPSNKDSSMVLFCIGMYGETTINEANYLVIKELMALQHCLGIVGGIGNRAFYIVGFQGDKLLVLDPHTVQKEAPADDNSFLAKKNVKIKPYNHFNPCLCMAFMIRNRSDLVNFSKSMAQIADGIPNSYLYVTGVQELRKWLQDSGYTVDPSLSFELSK